MILVALKTLAFTSWIEMFEDNNLYCDNLFKVLQKLNFYPIKYFKGKFMLLKQVLRDNIID